jgi:hypothetical protein
MSAAQREMSGSVSEALLTTARTASRDMVHLIGHGWVLCVTDRDSNGGGGHRAPLRSGFSDGGVAAADVCTETRTSPLLRPFR